MSNVKKRPRYEKQELDFQTPLKNSYFVFEGPTIGYLFPITKLSLTTTQSTNYKILTLIQYYDIEKAEKYLILETLFKNA